MPLLEGGANVCSEPSPRESGLFERIEPHGASVGDLHVERLRQRLDREVVALGGSAAPPFELLEQVRRNAPAAGFLCANEALALQFLQASSYLRVAAIELVASELVDAAAGGGLPRDESVGLLHSSLSA